MCEFNKINACLPAISCHKSKLQVQLEFQVEKEPLDYKMNRKRTAITQKLTRLCVCVCVCVNERKRERD